MGNRHSEIDNYVSISGNEHSIRDLKTQDEILNEKGTPLRVESFNTGFLMRDPIVEDRFIMKYGKYIYERFVYEDDIIYFLKYKRQKYAWNV